MRWFRVALHRLGFEVPRKDGPLPGVDYSDFVRPLPADWLAAERLPLWPKGPPGGLGVRAASRWSGVSEALVAAVQTPELRVFPAARSTGDALLIVPGGAFSFFSVEPEGAAPARRFAAEGLDVYVLIHRLPAEGWRRPWRAVVADAQRAVRLVRARHPTGRTAVLGFSAGGYVAAAMAAWSGRRLHRPRDGVDAGSARPDAVAMIYPIVTLAAPCPPSLRARLIGWNAPRRRIAAASPHLHLDASAPPTFLFGGLQDRLAPPDHVRMMEAACRAQGAPVEARLVDAEHGFGLGEAGRPEAEWPALFMRWLRSQGFRFADDGGAPPLSPAGPPA